MAKCTEPDLFIPDLEKASINKSIAKSRDIVQLLNPRTKRYLKVDRANAKIYPSKKTPGPYKGIPIVGEK